MQRSPRWLLPGQMKKAQHKVVKTDGPFFNAAGQTEKVASLTIHLLDKALCKGNIVKVAGLENVVLELLEMQTSKYCLSK